MGAYIDGGGGGRAGKTSSLDNFAFDQPFEISGKFDANTANQINEMFRILFKAVSRAQTKIQTLEAVIPTTTIRYIRRDLTAAEIDTLSTVPIVLVTGEPNYIIVPLVRVIEWTTQSAGGTGSFRTRYTDETAAIPISDVAGDFANIRDKYAVHVLDDDTLVAAGTNDGLVGSSLELVTTASAAAGTHIGTVQVYYLLVPAVGILD